MDASDHRQALARGHVSQSPSAMSNSSTSPVEGAPRGALSQHLHQSRSNQSSPIIGTGPFARSSESPRILQGSMSALGVASGATPNRDSPLTTPRNNAGQNGLVRTTSTPQVATFKESPPNSAAALAVEKRRAAVNKAEEANMFRTSSIDSTHSSMSSATTFSQHSSGTEGGVSPAEIASMIQMAGSAENLIRQLLKEKRSAAAQNNQLFKLLNKQKGMMQGMHVDLEKAMVDREKYKKIAEQLTNLPITPEAPWQARKSSPAISNSSAPSSGSGDPLPIQRFPDVEHVPAGVLPITKNETGPYSQAKTAASMPRTLSDTTVRPEEKESKRNTAIQTQPAPLDIARAQKGPSAQNSPQSPRSPKTPDDGKTSFTARRSTMTSRKDSGAQSIPGSPGDVTSSPNARKAPPAPLNLGKPPQASPAKSTPPQVFDPADHTDSDYEETDIDLDDLPTFERGRKKTREEDDHEREVMMIRAQRASQSAANEKSRSKSSKKSSVKGQASPPIEELPKSPSFKSFSPPESPKSFGKGQPASIAGLLSAQSSASAGSLQERVITSPLKSPGLPLSPRPQDRPVNAAAPRPSNTSSEGTNNGATLTLSSAGPPPAHAPPAAPAPLSPRPPRHPIPMPSLAPTAPLPQPPMSAPLQSKFSPSHNLPIPQSAALHESPKLESASRLDGADAASPQPGTIYRGLVSESYPDLLLPPNALPSIVVKATSSRLRPARQSTPGVRNSSDDSVFTLGVFARSNNKQLWRVEKAAISLVHLEYQLKAHQPFDIKVPDRALFTGHAPARIDARRSALETMFETLLDTPMNEKAAVVLCRYFSTQVIPTEEPGHERGHSSISSIKDRLTPETLTKEGYLTKKGKNFGGWKARYFVLYEPILRYYESPGGTLLGAIKLTHAQIGRQSAHKRSPSRGVQDTDDDADNQYRHAFLIMEPKRKDSSSQLQHVLCAESDTERDEWVEALMSYLGKEPARSESKDKLEKAKTPTREGSGRDRATLLQTMMKEKEKRERQSDASDHPPQEDALRGFSYSDSTAGQAPVMKGAGFRPTGTPPPNSASAANVALAAVQAQSSPNQRNISGPKGGAPIEDASTWGNKDPMSTSKDMISGPRNGAVITDAAIWGNKDVISGPQNAQPITDASRWGNKTSEKLKAEETAPPQSSHLQADKAEKEQRKRSFWGFRGHSAHDSAATALSSSVESDSHIKRMVAARPVFGIPLAEAVQYCMSPGSPLPLPSVVFRCLEYLEANGAEMEEGIFRISGSTIMINKLKDRFNAEGDVDLCHERLGGFDVHTIASLLKLFLRELPERVLTSKLYPKFLAAQDLDSETQRVAALNVLVHRLPLPNWTLIHNLIKFLVQVDASSEMSKMTVRNIGIVFAPTLNLSNPIIAHFIRDFGAIFETHPPGEENGNVGIEVTAPSPRAPHQSGPSHSSSVADENGANGLGLQYDDVMQLANGLNIDDGSSTASDSTRMTNSSSARVTPVSAVGVHARNGENGLPLPANPRPQHSALGPPPSASAGASGGKTVKQKRRESSMQSLMGGFPAPGALMGPNTQQRKSSMPLMREE